MYTLQNSVVILMFISISVTAVDCGALPTPSNGSSEGKNTTFPNTITFKCDEGFDLIGSDSRKCMADKNWSGVMPVCKGKGIL